MKRRIVASRIKKEILIGLLSFGLTCFQVVSIFSRSGETAFQSRQARSLTVNTEPEAIVWLDGIRYGTTDKDGKLVIKNVPAGKHTLRVRANGYKEILRNLLPAQTGDVEIALTKTTDAAELAYQEAEMLTAVDREKSAEAYRKAIKLRPRYPEAYLGLARVLSDSGNLEAAFAAIRNARRQRPGFAEAAAVEGRIHKESDEEEKALAAFKRAIAEGRGFQPEAYTGLGLLYKERAEGSSSTGDFEGEEANYLESAKYLKVALTQLSGAPDALIIYQLLGLIYERMKRYDEAIAIYEQFLNLFPDSNEAAGVRSFIVQLKKQKSEQ